MKKKNQKPGTTATLTNENIQLMLCNKYIKCYIKIESLLFKVNTLGSMRWYFTYCEIVVAAPGQVLVIMLWCHITAFFILSYLGGKICQSSVCIEHYFYPCGKYWTTKKLVICQSFQRWRKTKEWFRIFESQRCCLFLSELLVFWIFYFCSY